MMLSSSLCKSGWLQVMILTRFHYSTGKMPGPGLYQVLGLKSTATKEEVKERYYHLSKKLHPDKNAGDEDAADKFRMVTEAYEVLGNDKRKADYDRRYGNVEDDDGGGRAHPLRKDWPRTRRANSRENREVRFREDLDDTDWWKARKEPESESGSGSAKERRKKFYGDFYDGEDERRYQRFERWANRQADRFDSTHGGDFHHTTTR